MNLRHLSNLDLSWNRIAHLSEQMLRNNINLQILNLSFNAMSNFNVAIGHMKKLSILDLSYNQLVKLNLETRSALNQMQTDSIVVQLIGNNLICSCETLDFLNGCTIRGTFILLGKGTINVHWELKRQFCLMN